MRIVDVDTDSRLDDIQHKLDWITEELAASKRHREEMQELKNDLTVIAKDIFNTAVVELEDISPFVQTGDFKHLAKKVLRNLKPITRTISQFESLVDFARDAGPLNREIFKDILCKLDEFDRKGYFRMLSGLGKAVDKSVERLTEEDVARITENITSLIDLLKLTSQMNIPRITSKALTTMGELDVTKFEAQSLWEIVKDFNSPRIRRLLRLILMFLTSFSEEIDKNNKKE